MPDNPLDRDDVQGPSPTGDVRGPASGPLPPPGPRRQPFPSWKQALVTTFGGVVLAITACFGVLVSFGNNFERGGDPVFTPIAAIVFIVAVLVVLVGFVLILIRALRGRDQQTDAGGVDRPGGQP